jgi:hypothetical protein
MKISKRVTVLLGGTIVGYLPCGHVVIEISKGKNPTKILIRDSGETYTVCVPSKNISQEAESPEG